jgi:hypothetical protein
MSADPNQRPATCREFVEDLTGNNAAVHGPPSTAVPQVPLPGAPTTSDPTPSPNSAALEDVLWYMVYKGPDGQPHTVKGLTSSIRDNLRRGALGDPGTIMVSKTKTGPFSPLKQTVEFRDLLVSPATVSAKAQTTGKAPSAPPPGERTHRLPQPDVPDDALPRKKSGAGLIGSKAPAPAVKKPGFTVELPHWTPWALIGLLATAVAVLAFLVIRRGG